MNKIIITLLVISLQVSELVSMDVEQKHKLPTFMRASISIQSEQGMVKKEGFVSVPTDFSVNQSSQEVIVSQLKRCAVLCGKLVERDSGLSTLVQDNTAFTLILKRLQIVQNRKPNDDYLSSKVPHLAVIPAQLLFLKSLCEHGGNCESCETQDGWSFSKSICIQSLETPLNHGFCFPIMIQYHNVRKNVHGKVALADLCNQCMRSGNQQELDDKQIVQMVTEYVSKVQDIIDAHDEFTCAIQ